MPIDARHYREHLYRQRAHPASEIKQNQDSFAPLYLSLLPCIGLEYYAELRFESLPAGILFPAGYLLFWAFYYTYYKPGHLESKLATGEKWDILSVPTVLIGAFIWFVKVVVIELSERILFHKIIQKQQPRRPEPRPEPRVEVKSDPGALPRDISNALMILGLKDCRDWSLIHKRYRELAKKFHPDLNPDLTAAGNRFMIYDGAYRKLLAVKSRYFSERSVNG